MKAWFNTLKPKLWRLPFVCSLLHKKHWTWVGHGDYRIQHCTKCDIKWVTEARNVSGKRLDSLF